jgi:hypothetical protein
MVFTLHSAAVRHIRDLGTQPDCRAALLLPETERS